MRGSVLSLLYLCLCVKVSAQRCPEMRGSVNAFYDAKVIAAFKKNPDSCKSKSILNILSRYSRDENSYSFKSSEINSIYYSAIKQVIIIDTLINYSQKNRSTEDSTLKRLTDEYSKLKKQQLENDSIIARLETLQVETIAASIRELKLETNDIIKAEKFEQLKRVGLGDSFTSKVEQILKGNLDETKTVKEIKADTIQNRLLTNEDVAKQLADKTNQIIRYISENTKTLPGDLLAKIVGKKNDSREEVKSKLDSYLTPANTRSAQNNRSDSFYYQNETYSLSNFKMPSQSEVIDALAIYLAKRFKQEVALTLVDQLRKIIKSDQLVKDLFPETLKMFSTGKVYEMPSFGSAWSYAISKDFTELLPNLSKSTFLDKEIGRNEYITYLRSIVQLCKMVNKQFSYVDIITQLHLAKLPANSNHLFNANITALYIINKELFDTTSSTKFWIGAEDFYALSDDQLKVFHELLIEKYKDSIGSLRSVDWTSIDKNAGNMIAAALVQLNTFQEERHKALNMPASAQNIQVSDYWNFLNTLFETINTQFADSVPPNISKSQKVSNYCFEIYSLLTQKIYAGAALKVIDLLPELTDNSGPNLNRAFLALTKVKNAESPAPPILKNNLDKLSLKLVEYKNAKELLEELHQQGKDYSYLPNDKRVKELNITGIVNRERLLPILTQRLTTIQADIDKLKDETSSNKTVISFAGRNAKKTIDSILVNYDEPALNELIVQREINKFDSFRKLTGFLSDLLVAGNSKNLSQVIEKYALPPNSYKIKRSSNYSWDLNAYVGGYLATEFITASGVNSVAPVYGFSAPIGISYSWGKTTRDVSKEKYSTAKGNSTTVTFSLVDIGAVVAYRITNDASKGLPDKVTWAQFISPGLHLRYGIKDTPLCISLGIQSTPQLRSINATQGHANTIRTYAGAFFDLPLYNIYHR